MTLFNNSKYDVESIRRDFPVLARKVNGKPLVFLDNAASAQKPHQVIDMMKNVFESEYANVHRGLYSLSEKCTERFEDARKKVQKFINADSESEIVFVRGATEAINLVAASYGRKFLKEGDEVIISEAEHHSNFVPWQMLRDEKGIVLKAAPVSDDGDFLLDEYQKLLTERTKFVAITHMSNVLGSIFPVREITKMAHDAGAKVLLDGCQAITHTPVDVKELDCDFYAFSGHKIYAPTGIGVLYGKKDLLEVMPPYQGGGEMMKKVTLEKTTYAEPPARFEAGTPAFVEAIGLGAALDYVSEIGMDKIAAYEADLLSYATARMNEVDGLKIIGTSSKKGSVISFVMDCGHPHDIAMILDKYGIAVRAGHQCAQPLHTRMGITASARVSLGMYNKHSEIDELIKALEKVKQFLS